jgi:hypothetical protein
MMFKVSTFDKAKGCVGPMVEIDADDARDAKYQVEEPLLQVTSVRSLAPAPVVVPTGPKPDDEIAIANWHKEVAIESAMLGEECPNLE